MPRPDPLETTLLPGARRLLAVHARELPQRDDLCGAFCGALALRAAGVDEHAGAPVDQDAVALSGTTAAGVVRAVGELSGGRLQAIPYSGPWTPGTLGGLFDLAAAAPRPVALVANLATRHLWGAHPRVDQLLDYLLDGRDGGPAPDWDVGHFVCVVGRLRGPGGDLYGVADTYPSLGSGGVHLQPRERLAAAVERRDMPAGGVILVAAVEDAPAVRSGAGGLGLCEGLWDNGTRAPETEVSL